MRGSVGHAKKSMEKRRHFAIVVVAPGKLVRHIQMLPKVRTSGRIPVGKIGRKIGTMGKGTGSPRGLLIPLQEGRVHLPMPLESQREGVPKQAKIMVVPRAGARGRMPSRRTQPSLLPLLRLPLHHGHHSNSHQHCLLRLKP